MEINLILLLDSATCHTSWRGISWNSVKSMKMNKYYSQNIDDISKTLKTWGFICMEKELLPSNDFLSVFFSIFNHISMLRLYLMKKANTDQWNIYIAKAIVSLNGFLHKVLNYAKLVKVKADSQHRRERNLVNLCLHKKHQIPRYWVQVSGYKILGTRYWILGTRYWIQGKGGVGKQRWL